MIKVSPSILAADPLNMEADIRKMLDAGCDLLHVDIMDGHFVPNLSYGPALSAAMAKVFPTALQDVHLMLDNPEKYIDAFAVSCPEAIAIHLEIPGDVAAILKDIRSRGIKAVLTLKPATPAEAALPFFPLCDRILVMTVEPGYGGQSFMPEQLDKIRALRQLGFTGEIEADGGINMKNLPLLKEAGLDIAVMGTAMYRSPDPKADMDTIHQL